MEAILKKANRKAIAALNKRIRCSDRGGHLNNPKERRYWKDWYIRALWDYAFDMANDEATDETGPVCEVRDSITHLLQSLLPYPIFVSKNSLWTTIKLTNSSYILGESKNGLVVSATIPVAKLSKLSPEEASRLIIAFDNHIANAEKFVEDRFKAYMSWKKSSNVLHTTATAILSDILTTEQNIFFNIRLQKNGKLCCKVMEFAEWFSTRTIRTTWEELRNDFLEALKEIRFRRQYGDILE